MSDYERSVAELERLQEDLRSTNTTVNAVRRFGEVNRHRLKWVIATVILDICLSVATIIAAHTAIDASHDAATNQSALYASCRESNVVRARDVQLWDHVIALVEEGPHQSASSKATDAEFKAYVALTFKQQNCRAVSVDAHS